jgi:hypothetical protein
MHWIDDIPRDNFLWPVAPREACEGFTEVLGAEASQQSSPAYVDADNEQLRPDRRELQVVDPHHPPAVSINNLLVQDVALETQVQLRGRQQLKLGARLLERELAAFERPDLVPGHSFLAAAQDHLLHNRKGILDVHGQVTNSPDAMLVVVDDFRAEKVAQENHVLGLLVVFVMGKNPGPARPL